LQALDVSTEAYGSLLVPVLLSKLPADLRLILGREIKDEEWSLTKIMTLFREEIVGELSQYRPVGKVNTFQALEIICQLQLRYSRVKKNTKIQL